MKIQLKRSNQLQDYGNGNEAKRPTAAQMEYGELAVNYNSADPAIFMEDSAGNIVRIAGAGYDYSDLNNAPTIGNATITIKSSGGDTVGTFTTNQETNADITLPAGTTDTNTTYEISSEDASGTATSILRLTSTGDGAGVTDDIELEGVNGLVVSQTGNNKFVFTIPESATIYPPSSSAPNVGNEGDGDIWIDTTECPPVLKVWSDCDGTGQWYELTSSAPKPIAPDPGDITSPSLPGSGTQVDPYILTSKTTTYGSDVQTDETITISNQQIGELVQFTDENAGTNGGRFTQQTGIVGADGTWKGKLDFDDSEGPSIANTTFTGLLKIGTVYFQWAVSVEPALNLTVGKGSITPTSGEVGDTFTGTATLTDAVNPSITHIWELDGESKRQQTNTSSSDNYVPEETGSLTYRQEVTDDNNTSKKVGPTSDAVTVTPATGPRATMSGLRFSNARNTQMWRTFDSTSNTKTWTFSCWVKRTHTGRICLFGTQPGSTYQWIGIPEDGTLWVYQSSGGGAQLTGATIPYAVWTHVVVNRDNTKYTAYVNGEVYSGSVDASMDSINAAQTHGVGSLENGSNSETLDGYLSDVYFVDGDALPASTFAKKFDGDKWGPLNNTVVIENIKGATKSPYDSRANTSQVWRTNLSTDGTYQNSSGNGSPAAGFDGDASTRVTLNEADKALTLTFDPVVSGKIEVECSAGRTYFINDDQIENVNDSTGIIFRDLGEHTNVSTVKVQGIGSGAAAIHRIKVDGRVLVDQDVWNNSQMWSDYITSDNGNFKSSNTPDKAFNGDGGATICEAATQGTASELTFAPPSGTFTGSLTVEVLAPNSTGANVYVTDAAGTETLMSDSGNTWTATINGFTSFRVIGASGSSYADIRQVKIDGKILIDAGEQWNQSQVWSDNASGVDHDSVNFPRTAAFNGVLEISAGNMYSPQDTTGTTFTFPNLTGTKFEVYVQYQVTDGLFVNGQVVSSTVGYAGYIDVTSAVTGTTGTLDSIRVIRNTNPVNLAGVIVDDKILVDAGNFGTNGFYLPFNLGQTGKDWSSKTTVPANYSGNVDDLFNGSTSVRSEGLSIIPQNNKIVISNNFGALNSVGFWFGGRGSAQIKIIGTSTATSSIEAGVNSASNLFTFTSAVSNVNSIEIQSMSADTIAVYGVEVDGELLVNYSSIGVDMSDNENNFSDKGFGVGNSDDIWSSDLEVVGTPLTSRPPALMFNGCTSYNDSGVFGTTNGDSNQIIFTPSTTINVSTGVAINANGQQDIAVVTSSGTANSSINSAGVNAWVSIPCTGNLVSITLTSTGGVSNGANCAGIKVDGTFLIDKNQVDTVLDTPMKSYAMLESGTNGNLNGQDPESSTISVGTNKIYLESTAPSDLGASGDRHHVGIYDKNGGQKGRFRSDGNTSGFTTSDTYSWNANDLVGFAYDGSTGEATVFVNGSLVANGVLTGFASDDKINVSGAGAATFTVNFGQQPFVHTPPAGYEGLYQTWEQYARTALGYALDRIAKLEQLRLLDAATIEDLRTQIAGALSRIASIESDEVNDDAVDNSLITLVGSLSTQVTAFTDRIAQAEAAITDYEGRITTLES